MHVCLIEWIVLKNFAGLEEFLGDIQDKIVYIWNEAGCNEIVRGHVEDVLAPMAVR
jgi:hypothetical protein